MSINLTTGAHDDLSALIASMDDTAADHLLGVDINGAVYLFQLPDGVPASEFAAMKHLQYWYEPFVAGNGYVGRTAAADHDWVERVFRSLKRDWNEKARGYIDFAFEPL